MKIKEFITILVTITTITSCNPKLKLTGKVISEKPIEKIYYTFNNTPSNKDKFIILTNNTYSWSYSLDKLKSEEVKEIIFTKDIDVVIKDERKYGHRIIIDEVFKKFDSKKNIEFNTDLCPDLILDYQDINGKKPSKFVGKYLLTTDNGQEYKIKLTKILGKFGEYYSETEGELLNIAEGRWAFDNKENNLIFIIKYKMNNEIGLLKNVNIKYTFHVNDENNLIEFHSKKHKLEKSTN